MKENSIALLSDNYISPMLLNTLVREEVPVLVRGKRLKEELEMFYPGLKTLSKAKALDVISQEDTRLLTNSEEFISCVIANTPDPLRAERLKVLEDKARLRELVKEAYPGRSSIGEHIDEHIDEHIKGDEFACDAYISPKGDPVVLCIYAHPLRDQEDFRDIVYCTSADIMRRMRPRVSDFLRRLSRLTDVRGVPMHAEFRMQGNMLVPIRVNPLRFGSFSITDLAFFAFGLNPYRHYFNYSKPEWDRIISQAGEDIFFRVLARIPQGDESEGIKGKTPDHEEFADTIQDLVGYCKLDTGRYPAFSIAFGRTKDMGSVRKYLDLDFQQYY